MRAFATCALIGGALAVGLRSQVKNMLKAHTAGDSSVITGPIYWPVNHNKGECINEGTMLQYNKQFKDFEPCHNQGEGCEYIVVEPVYS